MIKTILGKIISIIEQKQQTYQFSLSPETLTLIQNKKTNETITINGILHTIKNVRIDQCCNEGEYERYILLDKNHHLIGTSEKVHIPFRLPGEEQTDRIAHSFNTGWVAFLH